MSSIGIMLMHVGLFFTIPVAALVLAILLVVYYRRWSAYASQGASPSAGKGVARGGDRDGR